MISSDFKNGASWLMSEENYYLYAYGQDIIGRPDGQFVAPNNQIDDLMNKYPNQPREWENALGLDKGSLGDNPYRINVYEPEKFNLRETNINMSGSNDKFIPGGKTTGGIDESVIEPIPNPEKNPEVGNIQKTSDYYKNTTESNSDDVFLKKGVDKYTMPTRGSPDTETLKKPDDKSPLKPDSAFAGHSSLNNNMFGTFNSKINSNGMNV